MIFDRASVLLVAFALMGILGLLWAGQALLRRFAPRLQLGNDRLAVESAIMLDARRRLWLVRCNGRRVLLMTGGPADLVIGWLPQAERNAERGACE
jgi:flagellar protein FliO/FliZ